MLYRCCHSSYLILHGQSTSANHLALKNNTLSLVFVGLSHGSCKENINILHQLKNKLGSLWCSVSSLLEQPANSSLERITKIRFNGCLFSWVFLALLLSLPAFLDSQVYYLETPILRFYQENVVQNSSFGF